MITDIEICDPDVLQKAFSCSWQSGGENREIQFWTTGADRQAEHLMQMAADERDQLRLCIQAIGAMTEDKVFLKTEL